ncbi:serine/threonine-protein kinase [Calycomorphotria hydatis]|uniref:Serine/threonine-protein kinase PknD n=1 Tax=Calycomorphotria hydatis TaxID=2528027 RepID=A0A517TAY2_9PLAN|nr:serine/threonine-protein kinase [Calycomorphotria hydatis]QDT65532.1 Serine/threonine-protein kinase PknD [Calycomorphotria hydatis]
MTQRSPSTDDQLVEKLLDAWEEANEHGKDMTVEDICEDYPDLLPEVRDRASRLQRVDRLFDVTTEIGGLNDMDETAPPENVLNLTNSVRDLRYLARGGLGLVFTGTQEHLRRPVAVKFLKPEHCHSAESLKRFRVEAEITSRLDHPGVIPVYSIGDTDNGQPCYAMRYVEGATLKDRALEFRDAVLKTGFNADRNRDLRRILTAFLSACRTIDYAHSRGIIHCDIKPENIMIGEYGETIVLDWGLALIVGRGEHHKKLGKETIVSPEMGKRSDTTPVGGTPLFMSPEQFTGGMELGPAADIYSLGTTLYYLLTGRAPYDAKQSLSEIRTDVLRGDAPRPRNLHRWISPPLEAICMKAMEVDWRKRYATAAQLGNEIENYLADERVEAYGETFSRKVARWMRRHRITVQAVSASMIVLLVVLAFSLFGISRSAHTEHLARVAADAAREDSIRLSAYSAAQTVGSRLSERFRILELEASNPKLVSLLDTWDSDKAGDTKNSEFDFSGLQTELMRIHLSHDAATGAKTWFLCDADGLQVARVPAKSSIGTSNYAFRDYFHGNGVDLEPGETGSPQSHILDLHRSVIYSSSNTSDLKFALTIPVWSHRDISRQRKFLGVLGMSIGLNDFCEMPSMSESNDLGIRIVDLRQNNIDDLNGRGIVVYDSTQLDKNFKPTMLPEPWQEEMNASRERIVRRYHERVSPNILEWTHAMNQTAAEESAGETVAASELAIFSPVVIPGREVEVSDTGLGVIVFDSSAPESR